MHALRSTVGTWAAVVALVCAMGSPSRVRAQSDPPTDGPPAVPGEAPLDFTEASYALELSAIDEEATTATVAYVAGISLIVLGLGTITATSIAGFCISWSSPVACEGPRQLASVGSIVGAVGAGVGLVGLLLAIGLDVDSGERRHSLRERRALHLGVSPGVDGGALVLGGVF